MPDSIVCGADTFFWAHCLARKATGTMFYSCYVHSRAFRNSFDFSSSSSLVFLILSKSNGIAVYLAILKFSGTMHSSMPKRRVMLSILEFTLCLLRLNTNTGLPNIMLNAVPWNELETKASQLYMSERNYDR